MQETRTISVTQEHIDKGVVRPPKGAYRDDSRDPVSLAIIEAFPGCEFTATEPHPNDPPHAPMRSLLYVEDGETGEVTEYRFPRSVWEWLGRFEKDGEVEPFTFEITVTESA